MFIFLTDTLWHILQHWEAKNKLEPTLSSFTSLIPACIYLCKVISNREPLQTTTLMQLGISNGRAAIRWWKENQNWFDVTNIYCKFRYATKQPGITKQLEKSLAEKMKEKQSRVFYETPEEEMIFNEHAPALIQQESEDTMQTPQVS